MRKVDDVRCPFCGKRDIEYGLALCAGCQADIRYDLADRDDIDQMTAKQLDKLQAKASGAEREFNATSFPFNWFSHKRLTKIADQMEALAKDAVGRAESRVDRRIARGNTHSTLTFTRGDRSIDVNVHIPADPEAQVDFDVLLVAHNGKNITKLGMSSSIKLVQTVPSSVLTSVSRGEASAAQEQLEKAGATVEIRSA